MKLDLQNKPRLDQYRKLKLAGIFSGAFLRAVLLGSALIIGIHQHLTFFSPPLIFINYIGLILLLLSGGVCGLYCPACKTFVRFGYVQIIIDTLLITGIIFVTGSSFPAFFHFLYLVVIIYASIVLSRTGGMFIAFCCCVQYGVLIALEFQGVIYPVGIEAGFIFKELQLEFYSFQAIDYGGGLLWRSVFKRFPFRGRSDGPKKGSGRWKNRCGGWEKLAAIGEMASGLAHEIKESPCLPVRFHSIFTGRPAL